MGRWLTRRLIITFITFIGITMLVFALMRLAPVDPVDLLLFNLRNQGGLPPADIQALHDKLAAQLGLDKPIPIQYLLWLKEIFASGSLGLLVRDRAARRLTWSWSASRRRCILLGTALILELLIGVPLGILAALRRNRTTDYVISALGLSVVAIPSFFLGLAAIYIFSVKLAILPAGGMFTPGKPPNLVDWLRHLIMPATILALAGVGPILRYVRTSILETLGKDYLVTARAKGLGYTQIVVRHAFPNGLLPLITLVGIHIGTPDGRRVHHREHLHVAGDGHARHWRRSTARTTRSSRRMRWSSGSWC